MSILVDLMLSENDKFKVCIRIPFAAIFVQCCGGVLLRYHPSVAGYFLRAQYFILYYIIPKQEN